MINDTEKVRTKCILYARFSDRPGADACQSAEAQLKDLRAYASKRQYEVVAEFSDKAISGGDDWQDRPGLFDAAHSARRGYLLLFWSFDRLFRDTEKALIFKSMLKARGVRIRSLREEAACDDSPVGDLLSTILWAVAQFNREMIRAQTRARMRAYQQAGKRMSAKPPWGATLDPANPARLVRDHNECAAIDTMTHLWREKQFSLRRIAKWLNDNHIPCRDAKRWHHHQVKRILLREGVL